MAVDSKYGRVTLERGDVGADEPVIVFRAQDRLLGKVLAYYHLFCVQAGAPRHHLDAIMDARDRVLDWQAEHRTKTPSSDSLAPREEQRNG